MTTPDIDVVVEQQDTTITVILEEGTGIPAPSPTGPVVRFGDATDITLGTVGDYLIDDDLKLYGPKGTDDPAWPYIVTLAYWTLGGAVSVDERLASLALHDLADVSTAGAPFSGAGPYYALVNEAGQWVRAAVDPAGLTEGLIEAHAETTTSVHGIADTADLVLTDDPRLDATAGTRRAVALAVALGG